MNELIDSTATNPNLKLVLDKAETAITAMSQKLGIAAEFVWPIMVQKQLAEVYAAIAAFLIVSVVGAFLIRYILLHPEDPTLKYGKYSFSQEMAMVFSALACIVTTVALFILLPQLFAPEAYALKEIATFFK